jgi:ABC-type multidrug transport system ATPase subunit
VNAVDGVTFSVERGEVFGLLGPNGAGKTTTIGILTTRVRRTAGVARVGGIDVDRDPVRARTQLAVVPQRMNLDRSLSIRQNLIFHAAYTASRPPSATAAPTSCSSSSASASAPTTSRTTSPAASRSGS